MSKNKSDILGEIKSKFKSNIKLQNEKRIWISTSKDKLIKLCKWLKDQGFIHLSAISVTDWVDEEKFELTYHLWSYNDKILITLKTKINRNNPAIDSVSPIWDENAQIHERELHELFGVEFNGNPDLSSLFLEDWNEKPPFRKDFDWRRFIREKYYDKKNDREKAYYD